MSVEAIQGLKFILHCPMCHCTRYETYADDASDITKMRKILSDDKAFKREMEN